MVLCTTRWRIPDLPWSNSGQTAPCVSIFSNLVTLLNKDRSLLVCIWHWNISLNILSSAMWILEEKSFSYSITFSWLSASLIDTSAILHHRTRERFLPICLVLASTGWGCCILQTSANAMSLGSRTLDCFLNENWLKHYPKIPQTLRTLKGFH